MQENNIRIPRSKANRTQGLHYITLRTMKSLNTLKAINIMSTGQHLRWIWFILALAMSGSPSNLSRMTPAKSYYSAWGIKFDNALVISYLYSSLSAVFNKRVLLSHCESNNHFQGCLTEQWMMSWWKMYRQRETWLWVSRRHYCFLYIYGPIIEYNSRLNVPFMLVDPWELHKLRCGAEQSGWQAQRLVLPSWQGLILPSQY